MRSPSFLIRAALVSCLALAGCGDEKNGTVGLPCATDLECGPTGQAYCGIGFTQLAGDDTPSDTADVLGVVGLTMPAGEGYCMHTAGCTSDAECPRGSACYLPLANVDPAALTSVGFSATDLAAGHCLVPCDMDDDCRVDDGFVCGVPLEEELAGIPGVAQDTFCIPEPIVVNPCAPNAAWNTAGTCTLTYDIGGSFQITGTPGNLGNKTYPIGPGTLVVRVPSADGSVPSDGPAGVLCYDLRQQFGALNNVFTVVRAYSVDPAGGLQSTGSLSAGTITWDTCTPSPTTYCSADAPWTPADSAIGPGCLAEYTSVGDVYCGLMNLCSAGNLVSGHNPQYAQWTQPLHPFVFSGDTNPFDTVTMAGPAVPDDVCATEFGTQWVADKVQIPNDSPGLTFLGITGTLRTMECTAP